MIFKINVTRTLKTERWKNFSVNSKVHELKAKINMYLEPVIPQLGVGFSTKDRCTFLDFFFHCLFRFSYMFLPSHLTEFHCINKNLVS